MTLEKIGTSVQTWSSLVQQTSSLEIRQSLMQTTTLPLTEFVKRGEQKSLRSHIFFQIIKNQRDHITALLQSWEWSEVTDYGWGDLVGPYRVSLLCFDKKKPRRVMLGTMWEKRQVLCT